MERFYTAINRFDAYLLLHRLQQAGIAAHVFNVHVIDGELPNPRPHVVPGHEVVGTVAARAPGVSAFSIGDRVGVPWLGWTCGECEYCRTGRENLCDRARFTGYTLDGGYADFIV